MQSFCTQIWGKKNRNHVLYLPPLIALKMLVKEKAVVDTVVCPPSIWALEPRKIQKYYFLHIGP